ncbi:hypothetical protein BY996DRAFT_6442782 [Phakopsora pachyrhizi]|nr:hypothetical protein BY996DRAFT_6442782 [Phakopsora pachyrhizi]
MYQNREQSDKAEQWMVEENMCVKFISDEKTKAVKKVNGMKLFRDFGNNWLLTDCTEQYGRFRVNAKQNFSLRQNVEKEDIHKGDQESRIR